MEKIRKNLSLTYKIREKEVLNSVKFILDKKMLKALEIDESKENGKETIVMEYKDKILFLKKEEKLKREVIFKNEDDTVEFIKNGIINWEKNSKYYTPKIAFPLALANENEWNLTREDKEICVELGEGVLKLRREEKVTEEILKTENKTILRHGTVITIKVGKGGIGKSFITTQLATGIAEIGKSYGKDIKVLVITSDPQNDILGMTHKDGKIPEYKGGLKKWVTKGTGDVVKLRDNVFYIPLEEATFGNLFVKKLHEFFEKMKKEYDYILIDSMPMMAIDKHFHHNSDKVIIPVNGDKFTVNGAIKVIQEIGVDKVLAVVFNKFNHTAGQKKYFEEMEKALEGTNVFLPNPIKDLVAIYKGNENGKTVWENKNKVMEETKESFISIIVKIIQETYVEPEEV